MSTQPISIQPSSDQDYYLRQIEQGLQKKEGFTHRDCAALLSPSLHLKCAPFVDVVKRATTDGMHSLDRFSLLAAGLPVSSVNAFYQQDGDYLKLKRLQALVAILLDDNKSAQNRVRVIDQIKVYGEAAQNYIKAFVNLFERLETATDKNMVRLRMQVCELIGFVGFPQDYGDTPKSLVQALSSPHMIVRYAAAWTLGQVGKPTPDIKAKLKHQLAEESDERVKWHLAHALERLDVEANLDFVKLFPDIYVYEETELSGYSPKEKSKTAELYQKLSDRHHNTRDRAARVLADRGADPERLVKILVEGDFNRYTILYVIKKIGGPADVVLPYVLTLWGKGEDESSGIYLRSAFDIVARYGREARTAIPFLVDFTRSDRIDVRLKALEVLGQLGPYARQAYDDVAARLDDDVPSVRRAAARTLGRLGPMVGQKTMDYRRVPYVQRQSYENLDFYEGFSLMGPPARWLENTISSRAYRQSSEKQVDYLKPIHWMSPHKDASYMPRGLKQSGRLANVLKQIGYFPDNPGTLYHHFHSLGKLKIWSSEVKEVLLTHLNHKDEKVRLAATKALSEVVPEDAESEVFDVAAQKIQERPIKAIHFYFLTVLLKLAHFQPQDKIDATIPSALAAFDSFDFVNNSELFPFINNWIIYIGAHGLKGKHRDDVKNFLLQVVSSEKKARWRPYRNIAINQLAEVINDPDVQKIVLAAYYQEASGAVRKAVVSAVGNIQSPDHAIENFLRQAMEASSSGIQAVAIRSFGRLFPDSTQDLPNFVALMTSPNSSIRKAATWVVKKMAIDDLDFVSSVAMEEPQDYYFYPILVKMGESVAQVERDYPLPDLDNYHVPEGYRVPTRKELAAFQRAHTRFVHQERVYKVTDKHYRLVRIAHNVVPVLVVPKYEQNCSLNDHHEKNNFYRLDHDLSPEHRSDFYRALHLDPDDVCLRQGKLKIRSSYDTVAQATQLATTARKLTKRQQENLSDHDRQTVAWLKSLSPAAHNNTLKLLQSMEGKLEPSWVDKVIAFAKDHPAGVVLAAGVTLAVKSFVEAPIKEYLEANPGLYRKKVIDLVTTVKSNPPYRSHVNLLFSGASKKTTLAGVALGLAAPLVFNRFVTSKTNLQEDVANSFDLGMFLMLEHFVTALIGKRLGLIGWSIPFLVQLIYSFTRHSDSSPGAASLWNQADTTTFAKRDLTNLALFMAGLRFTKAFSFPFLKTVTSNLMQATTIASLAGIAGGVVLKESVDLF